MRVQDTDTFQNMRRNKIDFLSFSSLQLTTKRLIMWSVLCRDLKKFYSIRRWRTWNRKNELLKYSAWLPPTPLSPLALGKEEISLICFPLTSLVVVALDCHCLWQFRGYFYEIHKKHQKRMYEKERVHIQWSEFWKSYTVLCYF